jgi:GNAT superfamily N-acetyltransferase
MPDPEEGRVVVMRAVQDDARAISDCLLAAFEPFFDRYTPDAFADTVPDPDGILDRMRSMAIFVAVTEEGEVVGTVGGVVASGAQAHIRGMAVHPEYQGTGVAQALLEAVEAELRNLGCGRVTLDTTAPLERAERFYEKSGFVRTGRISDFFGMPVTEFAKDLA